MRRVGYYLLLEVDIKFVSAWLILFSAGASLFFLGGVVGGIIGIFYEYNYQVNTYKKSVRIKVYIYQLKL